MVNQKRLVDNFIMLARIKSFSGQEREIAEALISKLEYLGSSTKNKLVKDSIFSLKTDDAGNIYAFLPGNADGFESLMLCCHMDTVRPGNEIKPIIKDGVITNASFGILGADDKAGIAAVMELLHVLIENNLPHGDLEIIFTVMEEAGMAGSKSLDYKKIKSKICYVMDGSMSPGLLTTAAPYKNRINIKITGKSAHAGTNPENGISSIQVAAKAIAGMRLLRVDDITTANIGTISGGAGENVVCSEVVMKAEVRSHDYKRLEEQTKHMRECIDNSVLFYGAKAEFDSFLLYCGYNITENDYLIRRFKNACSKTGLEFGTCMSGGGSDANIFNSSGIKAAVMGIGVKNPHTERENISVKDLTDTAELLTNLVRIVESSK